MNSLLIDFEFELLAPILTDEQMDALEENLFDAGCKEPIHTWNGYIIDGHKRYSFCKKWDIPFIHQSHNFTHRCEAIIWICQHNIHDPNLSEELRKYIIGKHYEAAKEFTHLTHTGEKLKNFHYKIATDLGHIYSAAPNTVYKYGIYTRCLDNILAKEPQIVKKIFSGKLRISHNNIIELSRLPKDTLRKLNAHWTETRTEHIGYSDMRFDFHISNSKRRNNSRITKTNEQSTENNAAIKQMPKYDPDAEISSLSLTIPSWISSIQRTQNTANIPLISDKARIKLRTQLDNLSLAIEDIQTALEEEI